MHRNLAKEHTGAVFNGSDDIIVGKVIKLDLC